jgi:hypothetical protein
MNSLNEEEQQLDAEITKLQEELLKAVTEEKNLEIAQRILQYRESIERQFKQN